MTNIIFLPAFVLLVILIPSSSTESIEEFGDESSDEQEIAESLIMRRGKHKPNHHSVNNNILILYGCQIHAMESGVHMEWSVL